MSVFSTSPKIRIGGGGSLANMDRLPFSKRFERCTGGPTEFFKTNPNTISPFTDKYSRWVFPHVSPQPMSKSASPINQLLAARKASDCYRGTDRATVSDDSSNNQTRPFSTQKDTHNADPLARTVHLSFLPNGMKQGELAELCRECGEYYRVRICGNSRSNQNWIYAFVEFGTREAANKMIKSSGMELSNGPGRPPLRLKCSGAKQRIMDRVFHDANPETGTPCTFGLGNYSSRSLKDAVDSYFNLKAKEAQAPKSKPPPCEDWHISSHADTPLSPNRLLFHSAFGGAVHPFTVSQTTRLGDSNRGLFASLSSGITQPTLSESDGSDCLAEGGTPRFHLASSGSPTVFAELPGSPNGLVSLPYDTYSGSTNFPLAPPASPAAPTFLNFSYPTTLAISPTTDQSLAVANGNAVKSSPGPGLAAATTSDFAAPSRCHAVSPPVLGFNSLRCVGANGTSAGGGAAALTIPRPGPTTQLTDVLRSMIQHGLVTDGEVIVEQGRRLLLQCLRHAHTYRTTEREFQALLDTASTLLGLLGMHGTLTGGPTDVASGGVASELPQRVTQIRLLTNLLLALLYFARRSPLNAQAFVKAIVDICGEIPRVRVRRLSPPAEVSPAQSKKRAAASPAPPAAPWSSMNSGPNLFGSNNRPDQAPLFGVLADAPDNLRCAVMSALPEDESEVAVEPSRPWERTTNTEAFCSRDVAFHSYVLSVLVTIGLSIEVVNPLLTCSVSLLAKEYAQSVLGMRCIALDALFQGGTETPNMTAARKGLRTAVAPGFGESHDITSFPCFFFRKLDLDLLSKLEDPKEFWARLPPMHCVRSFPF